MGIDFSRVASSALQAALEGGQQPEPEQHHRRLTAGKAIIAGAAVAVAAKYAVDKTSGLKGKAAMAALRHTARTTFGDLVPEALHDKLMDSGFFDHEDEDFDGSQGETQDFFEEPEGEQSEDQESFDEPEDEEGSEPEDEEAEEPEDEGLDEAEDDEEPEAEEEEDEPVEDEEPEAEDEDEESDEVDDEKKPRRSRGRTKAKKT